MSQMDRIKLGSQHDTSLNCRKTEGRTTGKGRRAGGIKNVHTDITNEDETKRTEEAKQTIYKSSLLHRAYRRII